MKQKFNEFFPITGDALHELWKNATFVFDTNVLLGLYRLPRVAREEYIAVLKTLRQRVWIPHHVALEFNLRRPSVISQQRKLIEGKTTNVSDKLAEALKEINSLEIGKHLKDYEGDSLTSALKTAADEFSKVSGDLRESIASVSNVDPIRDELDEIFSGLVGDPLNEEELAKLHADGEQRFSRKIPPGFADEKKEKNENEATFAYDGLEYSRKFGDLILWKQTLHYAEKNKKTSLIFVTGDSKEDWWWKEGSTTLGPHPSLRKEIESEAGVKKFWMYNSAQFAKFASEQIQANFSAQSLKEIKAASSYPQVRDAYPLQDGIHVVPTSLFRKPGEKDKSRLQAVKKWYNEVFDKAVSGGGYPDLFAYDDRSSIAIELIALRSSPDILFMSVLNIEIDKLQNFAVENDFTTAQIVLLFESEESFNSSSIENLYDDINKLVSKRPDELTIEVLIAHLGKFGEFQLDQVINSELGIVRF